MDSQNTLENRDSLLRLMLVALSVVIGLQVLRPFFALVVYNFGERYGLSLAAVPALIVFLTPFALPLLVRLLNPRRALMVTLGGLALARLVLQVSPSAELSLIVSGIGSALAVMSLPLGLIWGRTADSTAGYRFAAAIFVGMALDVALNSAFLTWDYVWQGGTVPLVLALILSGAVIAILWRLRTNLPETWQEGDFPSMLPIALLGPFFMLQMMFLQNVPFIASATGLTMPLASGVALLGDIIALLAIVWLPGQKFPAVVRLVDLVAITVLAYLIGTMTGMATVVLVLVAQAFASGLIWMALTGRETVEHKTMSWRTSTAIGIGSLLFIFLSILYYISYDIKLPFPNTILPPVAGFLLGLAAFVNLPDTSKSQTGRDWRLAAIPLILLVIPVLLLITRPTAVTTPLTSNSFRLVDYNIHQAINTSGSVDPEAIAQVIESYDPDVVTLQEVTRGWLISGSLDIAEWLSIRLGMPYYYAPAADGQFGNLVLSRINVSDWHFEALPLGDVTMARSYLRTVLETNDEPFVLINTHLHHITEDTAVRIPQVETVVKAWNQTPRTVITGDMNARPGEDDIVVFSNGGLINAQDEAGNPTQPTFSSADPFERIDWIFGSPDITFSEFGIGQSTASDHLPLVVTVTLP